MTTEFVLTLAAWAVAFLGGVFVGAALDDFFNVMEKITKHGDDNG